MEPGQKLFMIYNRHVWWLCGGPSTGFGGLHPQIKKVWAATEAEFEGEHRPKPVLPPSPGREKENVRR